MDAYEAPFEGSAGGTKPIVGIAASGSGYYLVANDGGVFSYNAPFLGFEGRQASRRSDGGDHSCSIGVDGCQSHYLA
jgi:hypothetical protein